MPALSSDGRDSIGDTGGTALLINDKEMEDPSQLQKENETPTIDLNSDILAIMGDDPASEERHKEEIHVQIVSVLEHIVVAGLSKKNEKAYSDRYLILKNRTLLESPIRNLEIKAALFEVVIKRDKSIEATQKQLATAMH